MSSLTTILEFCKIITPLKMQLIRKPLKDTKRICLEKNKKMTSN
jgi:hypothetical protein